MNHEPDALRHFPPQVVVEIKALACQLPADFRLPLSHFTHRRLAALACERGLVASISGTTIWRWLSEDAIKPWQVRSWIFPRDPDFQSKANRILDLYHRRLDGVPLGANDYVLCADEKTGIQALRRLHHTIAGCPRHPKRLEFEYERSGTLAYLAAWDVHHARLFGRCTATTGILPFAELVDLVMRQEPYRSAARVFWIVDNGSSHRGESSLVRLRLRWNNAILVHLPIHASWLNQIEIYFSIMQRQLLTPNDFASLEDLKNQMMEFQALYQSNAKPFQWKFTKEMLAEMIGTLQLAGEQRRLAA